MLCAVFGSFPSVMMQKVYKNVTHTHQQPNFPMWHKYVHKHTHTNECTQIKFEIISNDNGTNTVTKCNPRQSKLLCPSTVPCITLPKSLPIRKSNFSISHFLMTVFLKYFFLHVHSCFRHT